ncbi:hypothetical protein [Arthrobacter sp. DR-2P]|nr:hypothetical protein [Arthrobacter sp. DR-2P]
MVRHWHYFTPLAMPRAPSVLPNRKWPGAVMPGLNVSSRFTDSPASWSAGNKNRVERVPVIPPTA